MKKDNMIFIKHILDAINLIKDYLNKKEINEFIDNHMLQDAVIREIEIIGEAAKNLSENFKSKYSEIPWRKIAEMRDKLLHGYFGVDLEAVWDTATIDIQTLEQQILYIVKMEENK